MLEKKIKQLSTNPTVTIGIPAYNEQHNIGVLLKQLLSQKQEGYILEKIIVASDGSTDGTAKVARKFANRGVVLIDGKNNYGQNYRQNQLISSTSSDILVLLNADIYIGDKLAISRLIRPITKWKADLCAQWAIPLSPSTLLERILYAGFTLKHFAYVRHRGGDNIFTCVGHMRALSRKFYSQIMFPGTSEGEDQYLYLSCLRAGYRYKYSHATSSYFKLPDDFQDYKKYAKRIFQTQKKFGNIFGEELVRNERSIPAGLKIRACLHALKKHPLSTPLYIVLHVAMHIWAMTQPENPTTVFEISRSTKKFTVTRNKLMTLSERV